MSKPTLLPTPRLKAVKTTVEVLEDCLRLAKAGEVLEVCVVMVTIDGSVSFDRYVKDGGITMLGGLELAKHDILEKHHGD